MTFGSSTTSLKGCPQPLCYYVKQKMLQNFLLYLDSYLHNIALFYNLLIMFTFLLNHKKVNRKFCNVLRTRTNMIDEREQVINKV